MRIAVFTNNYRPFLGGVTRSIETFAKEFRAKGHAVWIFAPRFGGDEPAEEGVTRAPAIPRFNHTDFALPLPFSLRVRQEFKRFAPDLVHVQHPFLLGEMGLHLARSRGLPVVLTYHTQYEKYAHYTPVDSERVRRWIVNVCTSFCNLCDLVVAPSRDIRETLRARGVETEIQVIPTGVDLSVYDRVDPSWLRRRLGLAAETPILVHVGRLAKEKNLGLLVEAAARAMERRRDLVWVVAGRGDREEALRARVRELGLAGRVRFFGTMAPSDLANLYAGAWVFVFASTTETQGLVVLEAMAAGAPVAAVDAPGVRDMVVHGEQGLLCAEEPDALAGAVLAIVEDPERRRAMSRAARGRARDFSSSAMADRLLAAMDRLRGRGPAPDRGEVHRFLVLKGILRDVVDSLRGSAGPRT